MSAPATCQHPGRCPNQAWAHGWCSMHYSRVYSTGDPGPVGSIRKPPAGQCRHPDGCPARGNGGDGWCHIHRRRIRSWGHPGPVERVQNKPRAHSTECLAPNEHDPDAPEGATCGLPTVAAHFCATHAKRIQRNGTLKRTRARTKR